MIFYIHRCDRNGHITGNIFHYYAMISSLAKVVGLQSPFFLAHFGENERSTNMFLRIEITSSNLRIILYIMAAVIILVMLLIIFLHGSL